MADVSPDDVWVPTLWQRRIDTGKQAEQSRRQ
jgi:hypothetical protein